MALDVHACWSFVAVVMAFVAVSEFAMQSSANECPLLSYFVCVVGYFDELFV